MRLAHVGMFVISILVILFCVYRLNQEVMQVKGAVIGLQDAVATLSNNRFEEDEEEEEVKEEKEEKEDEFNTNVAVATVTQSESKVEDGGS